MAGISPEAAPHRRYIPRGYSLARWMLVVTTGAILITSVDRAIPFGVLPAPQEELGLSNTAAGFLGSLNSLGVVIGAIILGVFGNALGKGINWAWTWAVAVTVTIISSVATAFVHTLGGLQFSSTAAGFVIDTYGHSANFVFLTVPCLLALIPIFFMRETAVTGGAMAQE